MHQPEIPGLRGAAPAAQESALLPQAPSGRLSALLFEHQRLLKRVASKQRALERLREEHRRYAVQIANRIEPFVEKLRVLDQEVHALFGEILAGKKLSRKAKREVREVHELLQHQGVLSPQANAPEGDVEPQAEHQETFTDPGAGTAPPAPPQKDRARHAGLRDMFLRLASALHPDKAQGGDDLATRTEAMKDLNRAYQDGNLARLLEIEKLWSRSQTPGPSPDNVERRCEALERTNEGLREQLKDLAREVKEIRRSELGRLLDEHKRMRRGGDPVASMEDEAKEEVERLTELGHFVRAFRDGRISLEEFIAGPPTEDEASDECEGDFMEALVTLAAMIDEGAPRPAGKRRRPQRRKRRRG